VAASPVQKEPAETTIAVTFLPHLAAFAVSYVTFPFLEIGPLVNISVIISKFRGGSLQCLASLSTDG
jgi:hypothetical protein